MKLQVAEWILSLVLPPERTASTVGDWIEETADRGQLWFWSCVFRTLFARVWSDLTDNPTMMAVLGLSGFAQNLAVAGGLGIVTAILLNLGHHSDIRYGNDSMWTALVVNREGNPLSPPRIGLTWGAQILFWFLYSARLAQTGQWIARRMPGRELAGCVSISLAGWIAILALEILWLRGTTIYKPEVEMWTMGIIHDITLCLGALWVRRRAFPLTAMG